MERLAKDLETFTRNIVLLRKSHKLSKKALAALLGIGVGSLTKLEKGEIPPMLSIDIFFKIQKHFGYSPAEQLEKCIEEP